MLCGCRLQLMQPASKPLTRDKNTLKKQPITGSLFIVFHPDFGKKKISQRRRNRTSPTIVGSGFEVQPRYQHWLNPAKSRKNTRILVNIDFVASHRHIVQRNITLNPKYKYFKLFIITLYMPYICILLFTYANKIYRTSTSDFNASTDL